MMTSQRQFYLENGFVVTESLIPTEYLERVFVDISRIFNQLARRYGIPCSETSSIGEFSRTITALFRADLDAYAAAAKLAQHTVSLHRFALCDDILGMLSTLGMSFPTISTRPVLHIMADALKFPGGYHKTPPHQDWRSIQGSLDSIAVWIPLFDVDRESYPLEVIPSSHRHGLLASEDDPFGHRVTKGAIEESAFEPVELSRGDAVFLSNFLVHRTGATGGDDVRVAASFRFNNAAEPSFIRRNYPNPYIYRPDMQLLFEGFPNEKDIAAHFPPPSRGRTNT